MILLDTHVWVWWASSPEKLSKRATEAIETASSLGIAVISCWEVAMLVAKERLAFNRDVEEWIQQALELPKIRLIDLTPKISVLSTRLPGKLHQDPADRFIVATCQQHACKLVTKDAELLHYPHIQAIW